MAGINTYDAFAKDQAQLRRERARPGELSYNPGLMDMMLTLYLEGAFAASVNAHPEKPAEVEDRGSALTWMSSEWDNDTPPHVISDWLQSSLPENGNLAAWTSLARLKAREWGAMGGTIRPETIMWAHNGHEYPGAVQATRNEELPPGRKPISAYEALPGTELRDRLVDAMQMCGALKGSPRRSAWESGASLSGVRPKVSLTPQDNDPDKGWLDGGPGQASTWIIKVEDSLRNKGEAGIESICQAALQLSGIPAAQTRSRMLDGIQCVLSQRCDRRVEDGFVRRIHQEEFRQACGYGAIKHWIGAPEEPGCPRIHAILRKHGKGGAPLTRFLAASWLLGHGDLHRGNIGLTLSADASGQRAVDLAPAYDVSSAVGTRYNMGFVLPIGGQHAFDRIGIAEWGRHAAACNEDVDETLALVAEVAERLPDAFSQAAKAAKHNDENRDQGIVDERANAIQKRMQAMTSELRRGRVRDGPAEGDSLTA